MAHIGTRKGDADLIVALASGRTVRDAAKHAKVGERTAHRRLGDREFRRKVSEARAEMIEQAAGRLAKAASTAVTTLRKLLKAESESVRLGACRAILESCERLRQSADLEQRIAELERRDEEPGKTGGKTRGRHQAATNGRYVSG